MSTFGDQRNRQQLGGQILGGQRDLAGRVGLTLGYVEKIEQRRKVPTLETLAALTAVCTIRVWC